MRRPFTSALYAIAAAALLLAGCRPRDDVIAHVRDRTITIRDVRVARARALAAGDSAMADPYLVFDALLTRALLLEAATDLRRAGALAIGDSTAARGDEQLLDALYRVEVVDRVGAPDDSSLARRFATFKDSLVRALVPRIDPEPLDRLGRAPPPPPIATVTVWALAVVTLLGLALRFAPVLGDPMRPRAVGVVVLRWGLAGWLLFSGMQYLGYRSGASWDFTNYHRAAREMRAGSSPYDPETLTRDRWDPRTPYLYAPVTLLLFRPLGALPVDRAREVWFWFKLVGAGGLVALSWRAIAGRCPPASFVAMLLFGFNGALLLDLRSGNVSGLEALLLWGAFVAFLNDRRWLCAGMIALAAQFKLLPIVFLVLLAWPTPKTSARLGPILTGLALFLLLLSLPNLMGEPWAHGYLHNLERVRPYGETNPSALGIIDSLLAGGGESGGRGPLALWLWAVYGAVLLVLSAGGIRRAWRQRDPMEWLVTIVMLFILLTPRPVLYGYTLVLVPALWIVQRRWPRPADMATAVGVLTVQGFVMRGLARADFLPPGLPWFLSLEIANLPFAMTLVLWFELLRAPQEVRARDAIAAPGPTLAPAAPAR